MLKTDLGNKGLSADLGNARHSAGCSTPSDVCDGLNDLLIILERPCSDYNLRGEG